MDKMISEIAGDLKLIREKKPLVHHITNFVVMNETANATLCIGALPVMAHAREEVKEMVAIAGALLLNIGTLTPELVETMIVAGRKANELGIPVILDPVGAGATTLRTEASTRIMNEVKVSVVRGNSGEISILAGAGGEVKGVEAVGKSDNMVEVASEYAARGGFIVSVTGPQDIVTDGERVSLIKNGDPMMATITGTGCMSTTITAAFAGVQKDYFKAATGALVAFGIAGEKAAAISGEKPGTFHSVLYDALYSITGDDILRGAKIELRSSVAAK